MSLSRQTTYVIRFLMDECLPAAVRDNKYFMWLFYYLAYRGKDINIVMHYKKLVYSFSEQEYKNFYSGLNSISRNRRTDLNKQSVDFISAEVEESIHKIVDIGCGSGYLLKHLHNLYPDRFYVGCDIVKLPDNQTIEYINSDIQNLAIEDDIYDLVTCCHTLEHVVELKQAVRELIRICRKKLIIVVPCQRYYYYTLDEHIHFFTYEYQLWSLMGLDSKRIVKCEKFRGDWVIVINCEEL